VAAPTINIPPELAKRNTSSSFGKHGAVATEVKECSDLGVELLKKGGNAADAVSILVLFVFIIDGRFAL
jgi:gamma-glutamyltranspeptidase/glutathione hydrolase